MTGGAAAFGRKRFGKFGLVCFRSEKEGSRVFWEILAGTLSLMMDLRDVEWLFNGFADAFIHVLSKTPR